MSTLGGWPLWTLWSFGVVYAMRIALFWLFRRVTKPKDAIIATYAVFPILFILGFFAFAIIGMPLYGFDNINPRHWAGYISLFLSPIGLPMIAGAPIALGVDFIRKPWRNK
ncbi:MAG: hypothetical protein AAGH90_06305 [Pseudomonadota bacterium]